MDDLETGRLEEALRSSLRHVPAPDGFAERVRERVAHREAARAKRSVPIASFFGGQQRRSAWWIAAAAMLALSLGADLHLRHEKQVQTAAAQQQVDLAMQLTTHALDEVEMGVNRSPAGRFAHLVNEAQR